MPDWPALYDSWHRAPDGESRHAAIQNAQRAVAVPSPERWDWLCAALEDSERRRFVARVFHCQPVPNALFEPMLRAVLEEDASSCRSFLHPLIGTFGLEAVRERLREWRPPRDVMGRVAYWLRPVPLRR
ncbi:MAG: hypothetical protein AAGI52_08280 [Bacteroidota bacterium]